MTSLIRDGGAPMWAILLFGLVNLIAALRFAYRPARARLPPIVALALAVLFSIACGVMADIAAVGSKVPARPEWANNPRIHLILLQGLAESMAPGILGFSTLSLVALLCAVGLRRLGGLGPSEGLGGLGPSEGLGGLGPSEGLREEDATQT